MYLDIVALPNGEFYTLDENELEDALSKKLITKKDFTNAYASINHVEQLLGTNFNKLKDFTEHSFKILIKEL